MRSVFVLGLAAAAASSVLGAQTPVTKLEAVSSPSPIDKTTQTEDVAFQTEKYDRMTVPVTVSGTGPYRFLVDTGADRTAISRDIATNLKLEVGLRASLHSVAGVSKVATARRRPQASSPGFARRARSSRPRPPDPGQRLIA